jgi:phage-related minor tail protein
MNDPFSGPAQAPGLDAAARGLSDGLRRAGDEMRGADRAAQGLSGVVGVGLRRAMDQAIFGGAKLSDVLRGLGGSVARSALNASLAPVREAAGQGVGGLVTGLAGSLAGLAGFAKGGAFSSGRVRAFARGGVVDAPTLFAMRGGGAGLMGEAGPEAILPLARGPDGRLGVRGGGGGGVHVTLNVTTADAESFQRSRSQVAAALARAVDRGRRGL